MPGTSINFERSSPEHWRRVHRRLRDMAERAQDASPAWQGLITWFAEQNFEQWLSRGARYHSDWPPLAASTREGKLRAGYPLDPLIRTGRLAVSLSVRPMDVEHVTPHEMVAGTRVPYGRFHQRGTSRMPARQLFSPAQIRREKAATTAIANWIIKGEIKVGGRAVLRGVS